MFKILVYVFVIYVSYKVYKIYRLFSVVRKQQQEAFMQQQKFDNNEQNNEQNSHDKSTNSSTNSSSKDNHGGEYVDYEEVK